MRAGAGAATVAVVLLVVGAACSSGPEVPPGGVLVHIGDATVGAEVADTQAERATGLMNREHLDEDAGMLFVYTEPTKGAFWMKNTLIPLSIAFITRRSGTLRVVSVLDMEPCRKEPCTLYSPGVSYLLALEVNQGFYEREGVEEGAEVTLEEPQT